MVPCPQADPRRRCCKMRVHSPLAVSPSLRDKGVPRWWIPVGSAVKVTPVMGSTPELGYRGPRARPYDLARCSLAAVAWQCSSTQSSRIAARMM